MNDSTTTTTTDTSPHEEQRLGPIIGERICHKCNYVLTGQIIVRETKYNLLIVRCPECGAVSPLHEYPALGRWSRRLAAVAAGLLLLLVFAVWMANAGVFCGISIGAAEASTREYANILDQLYEVDNPDVSAANISTSVTLPGTATVVFNTPNANFSQWYEQQERADIIFRAGGWLNILNVEALASFTLSVSILAIIFGAFWSIVFIRRGVTTLFIWSLVISGTSLFFCSFTLIDWLNDVPFSGWRASRSQLGPIIIWVMQLYALVLLFIGMNIGRPIVRGLVRLLIPPKLWPSLSWLWIARGLEPPRPNIS